MSIDVDGLLDWLLQEGLEGRDEAELIGDFCGRLGSCGIALDQAVFFLDTLHPVLEARGYYWNVDHQGGTTLRNFNRPDTEANDLQWRGSPFFYMQEHGLSELHLPLCSGNLRRFAVLEELRKAGHSDYFVMTHPLGKADALGEMDTLFSRWSTKKAGGFSEPELGRLRRLVPALALCIKSSALRRVTGSLVEVYLGRDAGRRVLAGKIERGAVDSINTVLWFSDMRNYTSLSERVESAELITMLDDYAEAVITSVHSHGGDVLKLIGDGVLAIFSDSDPRQAAAAGMSAWRELAQRLRQLNRRRQLEAKPTTTVHVGLHVGEVFYGNIGSDERLDFTVIGPAVNEASRIVAACRTMDRGLVVSGAMHDLLGRSDAADFVDVGAHRLKGVRKAMRLFALGPVSG